MVLALLLAPAARGQQATATDEPSRSDLMLTLSEALRAFDRGSALLTTAPNQALTAFRDARDGFQFAVDAGVENGRLYYNLGNTHVRLGEIGLAIAAYRRAERMISGDEQLKANLRFARSLTRDHIEPAGKRALLETVFSWHYALPLWLRLSVGLAFYSVFWILLAIRVLTRARIGYPLAACLVICVTLAASVLIDLPARGVATEGVLIANDVVVRKGNGQGYDPQFKQPLHQGVEFELLEGRGGWVHLELADGNRGWVRQREVELF